MTRIIEVIHAVEPGGSPIGLTVSGEKIAAVHRGPAAATRVPAPGAQVIDAKGLWLLPAGVDAHVHSREPGLTHKEDWHSLARGAYRGGVTAVADMPNTIPPTMTRAAVLEKAALAAKSGIEFRLLAGVGAANVKTVGALLTDPDLPVCALKVFYGKTTGELMYDDLETLARIIPASNVKPIVFHSEDQCGIDCNHAAMEKRTHSSANADFAVHSEIRSSATAHASTKVILEWAKAYGRPVHIAHVSTPLEIEMIAEARAGGAQVTGEVAPHHLLLSTDDYPRLGALAKMNPPLRSRAEVDALLKLVGQGAVDMFATDHAPHTLAEKRTEVAKSPSGVPAVELFYPLVFLCAKLAGLAPERAVKMASEVPARLFGFTGLGALIPGNSADFVLIDPTPHRARNEEVVSKCGWTPYDGLELPCRVAGTWRRGERMTH